MRTSLIEVQEIENWVLGSAAPENQLLMEARFQLSDSLQNKAHWQAETYQLVHHYGRKKLRAEIKLVEQQVFSRRKYRSFQDRIRSIFKP